MELGWWKRDDEGKKYQVHLNLFGKDLKWTWQRARNARWEEYESPTDEDWETALELVENRYQRRLVHKKVVEMIRRRELR